MNPNHRKWSKSDEQKLRELWPKHSSREISTMMPGRTCSSIKSRADRLKLRKLIPWTPAEDATLCKLYPDHKTGDIVKIMGRPIYSIFNRAWNLGLKKSPEHLALLRREESARLTKAGVGHRFKPGDIPANKGIRRPGWGPGRMKETQFKKGARSGLAATHYMPVGSTRDIEGYLYKKVSDIPNVPYTVNWKMVHILRWQKHRGRVRKGRVVVFKDGNKRNFSLKNLECISRRELMSRNTIHRASYPPELRRVILLNGALKRQIRERQEKLNGKQSTTDRPTG